MKCIEIENRREDENSRRYAGDPWGNRTPVAAVRGRSLSRLTNGPYLSSSDIITRQNRKSNPFFNFYENTFNLFIRFCAGAAFAAPAQLFILQPEWFE